MIEVGFGLGSNVGDKQGNISRALGVLFGAGAIGFLAASSFYRTPPWGYEDQDWFVNACAVGRTALLPDALLARAKQVEEALGREKTFRWGPRLIDVDILYYGDREVAEPELAIPHRELFNRAFVLKPLAEIRPELVLSGRSVAAEADRKDEALEIVAPPWRPAAG
ncbi:2-amino-4-hydroxy-6-hydroxymethyldihydropteridine diphosphokinase [Lutibaculum baratangense]|uniref:2-amino-4-hydroxy-6-hydroxymethyldihydropteridine pyrophosphokinase n=1 Tax=Lutibaculum baratangense AMV1 TaxID=631454 RepID=V4RLQ7_9HYPH|nr:2-amino-4-hydroxy-6-hydroxymethyldihydropteridine diphosphokinase [Lutibaculum baratangense]ESR24185.1 2-amino-4-hydroxy-6- hydroxymethyldihydropteridine pyrophosphokinase [Lutibaculum baratangense AMV1]